LDLIGVLVKIYYNKKHRLVDFKVSNKVYLRLNKGYTLPGKPKPKWLRERARLFRIII
jgi:hypothetical protein